MASGQRVGYIRVSSVGQNPARQLDGIELDRVFTDTISGKSTSRPQLQAMLAYVRDGDTVIVHSMDRLARNLDDLRRLVRELTGRGVAVRFVNEQLTFTAEDAPMATLLLSVLGAFAEFERALIRERQLEGIALAKARGAYTGRKPSLTPGQAEALRTRAAAERTGSALRSSTGPENPRCCGASRLVRLEASGRSVFGKGHSRTCPSTEAQKLAARGERSIVELADLFGVTWSQWPSMTAKLLDRKRPHRLPFPAPSSGRPWRIGNPRCCRHGLVWGCVVVGGLAIATGSGSWLTLRRPRSSWDLPRRCRSRRGRR